MSDSNARDHLDAKHEHDREERLEAIKRWVEYIRAEPPETWGPQQNAVVDAQLDAAQSVQTTAAHQQHVRDVAEDIIEERDRSDETPSRGSFSPKQAHEVTFLVMQAVFP